MKSTGVIRRIDELGRIVIPKEIRKNLKIREGDMLEIYIEETRIILTKFEVLNDISTVAKKLVNIASNLLNKNIIITSLETVIASSKNIEKEYLNKELSNIVRTKIEERMDYYQTTKTNIGFIKDQTEDCLYYISPILASSDTIGAVILFDKNNITETDTLLIKMISSFLIKNVEE